MVQPERLVVVLGRLNDQTLPPTEIAACADDLAELYFLVNVAEPDMFAVARSLAPTTQADFSDRDACLDAVRRMGASKVGTFADPMCPLVAWLNASLGGDADTEVLWGRKDVQRQRLRAAGLSGVMSNRVSDGFALRKFARQAGFPVVVKPTDGAGSREVWLLLQEADVDAFLARSGTGHGIGELVLRAPTVATSMRVPDLTAR